MTAPTVTISRELAQDLYKQQKIYAYQKEELLAALNAQPEPEQGERDGGCTLAGAGRGDCEHFVGLPGKYDQLDEYGKPNGWCWSCWKSHRIAKLEALLQSPQPEQGEWVEWVPDMEHLANEWADAATNGPAYLDNVRDGIYTFEKAKEMMLADFAHCREVSKRVRAAMESSQPEPAGELPEFEKWWETRGQLHRAGGGDYEKTFAWRAWEYRAAIAQSKQVPLTDDKMGKLYRKSALQTHIMMRSDWEQGVRDGEAAHGIGAAQQAAQPQTPKHELVDQIKSILSGIDKEDTDTKDGWWETSEGAKFGADRLQAVIDAVQSCTAAQPQSKTELESACDALIEFLDKNPPMGESIWAIQRIRNARVMSATGGDLEIYKSIAADALVAQPQDQLQKLTETTEKHGLYESDFAQQQASEIDCRQCEHSFYDEAEIEGVTSGYECATCTKGDKFVKLEPVQLYRVGV